MYKNYIKAIFLSFMMLFVAQSYAGTAPVSDTVITSKVKAKVAADPTLSVFKVGITTKRGVVYINGLLDSETDADALIQMVQATNGVRDVNTAQLKIRDSQKPLTDTAITAKVKGLYLRDKLMGRNIAPIGIHVETNNGIVYLSGNVDDQKQVANAIRLAKSVKGVKKVESRVEVEANS